MSEITDGELGAVTEEMVERMAKAHFETRMTRMGRDNPLNIPSTWEQALQVSGYVRDYELEPMRAALTASALFRAREGTADPFDYISPPLRTYTVRAKIAAPTPQPSDPAPGGTVTEEMARAASTAYCAALIKRYPSEFGPLMSVKFADMRIALEAALSRPAPTLEEIVALIAKYDNDDDPADINSTADRILSLMQRGGAR